MSDLISRPAAIKAIEDLQDCYNGFSGTYDKACIIGVLQELPSAERRGKWIPVTNGRGGHECNQCHEYAPSYQTGEEHLSDFCPNCGARMEA